MRPTTRLRILDYLRRQQTASVHELSQALSMTGANIRHHLEVLESNSLIEMIGQRQEGRGRPENIYSLSRQVLGDGLDDLAGAVLTVWIRNIPDRDREAALHAIAQRLAGENPSEQTSLLSLRLAHLVDRLNELHYQARWEAGSSGPRVILGHCPYAAIIADYPELCRMDAYLLELWVGLPVKQTAKLQPSVKGAPFCRFLFLDPI